jgi:hypothetical protein
MIKTLPISELVASADLIAIAEVAPSQALSLPWSPPNARSKDCRSDPQETASSRYFLRCSLPSGLAIYRAIEGNCRQREVAGARATWRADQEKNRGQQASHTSRPEFSPPGVP